jgi:hypothetical protein
MPTTDRPPPQGIGFLTVVEQAEHGLFGGYLITNLIGRPLEFHCTTPIKANRAQQILYGPTLAPYLYGEQIGHALAAKAAAPPRLICTDSAPVLALRLLVATPVVLVQPNDRDAPPAGERTARIDEAHPSSPRLVSFQVRRHRLTVESGYAADEPRVVELLADLAEQFDLAEPFARIREAIGEAQRVGKG